MSDQAERDTMTVAAARAARGAVALAIAITCSVLAAVSYTHLTLPTILRV